MMIVGHSSFTFIVQLQTLQITAEADIQDPITSHQLLVYLL